MKICRLCGNSAENKLHQAREMMFGTREKFDYMECSACGTLQIVEIPHLAPHYPPDYCSFATHGEETVRSLKDRIFSRLVANYYGSRRNIFGWLISKRDAWKPDFFPSFLLQFNLGITVKSNILDFGSGSGALLLYLRKFGFQNLTGVDAFIEKDIIYSKNLRILKREINEFKPGFDLIMANHSIEHLPNPAEVLREFHRLLKPNKIALIRIPLVSEAWRKYGVNWVQLDPPRHLFLFTEQSFRRVAEEAGFKVEKVFYDSDAFQFWGSEQYLNEIPLRDERSFYYGKIEKTIFTQAQIDEMQAQAQALNLENKGDQACFYLRKN